MTIDPAAVHELLDLLGTRSRLLSSSLPTDPTGDLDVVVDQMDHRWPLRADADWRVVQYRNHDVNSWMWILDHDGDVLAIDAADDPDGLARYALPTSRAFTDAGPHVTAGAWAAYLVSKRCRQDRGDAATWVQPASLAAVDTATFVEVLTAMVGRATAGDVAGVLASGEVPDEALRRRVVRRIRVRRVRTPWRAARVGALGARRWTERLVRPTGLFVALVGPDGAGKSAIVAELPDHLQWLFLRMDRHHWRPGVLPRPGAMPRPGAPRGSELRDTSDPHGAEPHPRGLSHVLLAYYWLDVQLGYWLRYRPTVVRSGLLLLERGWDDMAVDPHRYRLDVAPALVTRVGRWLPRPDLTLVLDGDPDVLHARKDELQPAELARQRERWRELTADDPTARIIDVTKPLEQVVGDVRRALVERLEERTVARLPHGWVAFPSAANPRVLVPRAPRRAALAALGMYRPQVPTARLAAGAARTLATTGLLRLAPAGPAPDREVRIRVAPHVPPGGTIATLRSNHADRHLAMVFDRAGAPVVVVKIALGEAGEASLAREAVGLQRAATQLLGAVRAPALVEHRPGVLVTEAIRPRRQRRPWHLDPAVATALGAAYANAGGDATGGPAHGDFAPWNLLPVPAGWVLVDWEHHAEAALPFTDVLSWVTQAHALVGQPTRGDLLAGVRDGAGWVGEAVTAWAAAAGVPRALAWDRYGEHLTRDDERWDTTSDQGRAAAAARQAIRQALG